MKDRSIKKRLSELEFRAGFVPKLHPLPTAEAAEAQRRIAKFNAWLQSFDWAEYERQWREFFEEHQRRCDEGLDNRTAAQAMIQELGEMLGEMQRAGFAAPPDG